MSHTIPHTWPKYASPKGPVKLTRDEMRRIKCWIGMNCPLWGDYTYRLNRATKLAKGSN